MKKYFQLDKSQLSSLVIGTGWSTLYDFDYDLQIMQVDELGYFQDTVCSEKPQSDCRSINN